MDCHRNFSIASARDGSQRVVWRRRLNHADRNEFRKELGSWPKGTPVILEGTFGWGWISDEALQAGLEPHLCSGRKVAGWREARGLPKSNKRDADLISELWGEKSRWWEVWCAPPETRDLRELLRYRMGLVAMQTAIKNQVHATLHRHGLVHEFADLFGRAGRHWLSAVLENPPVEFRENGRRTLAGHLGLLDQVRQRIAAATRQFRATVRRHPAARRLMTLPGVSTILGYTIVAEVGTIDRFASGRCLSRYSLMAPLSNDSGEERAGAPIGRHVGKVGRVTLKWAWIEAARSAVRKSPRMRQLWDRYTDNGQHDRNRGYIAVGHQLCLIGYALWKKDVDYQEMSPLRPGSERWKQQQQEQAAAASAGVAVSPEVRLDVAYAATPAAQAKTRTRRTATVGGAPPRKTPHHNGNVFCGKGVRGKKASPDAAACGVPQPEQRIQQQKKIQQEKPGKGRKRLIHDVSRPGMGQPQTAMAAEAG
jgi:transposase